jgi:hypothetical protein
MDEMRTAPWSTKETKLEYATPDDVQKLFVAAMNDLFCLAFLLTAHVERAEDCLIRAIRECTRSTRILRENLLAWVRNSLIRSAIAIVTEFEGDAPCDTGSNSIPLIPESSQVYAGSTDCSAGIFGLSSFDRLVYVLCIVEHYTSRHCALLLRRSCEEVREARTRALAHIAEFESTWRDIPTDGLAGSRTESESSCGGILA